jgi:two-component system, NtrC family, sensor kinase
VRSSPNIPLFQHSNLPTLYSNIPIIWCQMRNSWLTKKLNLGLRTEIIFNISLLMLAAILLIGFSISKITEKNILEEKIRNVEGMMRDFQSIIDFISRDKKDLSLAHPFLKKEIQDFVHIYRKKQGFYDLVITDHELKVIASKRPELMDKSYSNDLMKNSIRSGQINTEVDKSGGFLSTQYRKLIVSSPLWIQGKIVGAIKMEIPIGDVMMHLLESQRVILLSIILDAIVLIVFGSFLLSRVLVKPLKDLILLTQKIGAGNLSEKIEVTSRNEIGQLIGSFNLMIERLKEKQESLDSHLESLEFANKKLKQTQEELIRTEKLASIGRFAAGVAHEVGNPLGAILGYTSILQRDGINQGESKDYLKRIEKEIERINRIVRELLDFVRPSQFEICDVEVNKVIENTLSLISHQKNFGGIKTQLDLQPNLPTIKGDESKISQVLINIVLNAIDAMPNGGILSIRTEEYVVEDSLIDPLQQFYSPRRREDPTESNYSHLRKPDPFVAIFTKFSKGDRLVKIRISDTGIGIKEEDVKSIFDPFFTTKAPDRGTGLGLSVSLRIVESMEGEIRVESEEGKGSAFEVYFPVATHGKNGIME